MITLGFFFNKQNCYLYEYIAEKLNIPNNINELQDYAYNNH